jgi:hypothetical protein
LQRGMREASFADEGGPGETRPIAARALFLHCSIGEAMFRAPDEPSSLRRLPADAFEALNFDRFERSVNHITSS